MKMRAWFAALMVLALGSQGSPLSVLADAELKLAERQPTVAEAVFRLSEQVKKEEMVAIKNYFENVETAPKPLPIEPALGREIQPDQVEIQ